jgi:hypothetical protein
MKYLSFVTLQSGFQGALQGSLAGCGVSPHPTTALPQAAQEKERQNRYVFFDDSVESNDAEH